MSEAKDNRNSIESSRRFYKNRVAPMIHEEFPEYEDRIAVGIAGEGSDCFGYDDFMSRDHDFGTGVCLWLTSQDMQKIGSRLTEAYNELVSRSNSNLTSRLMERRGVMTIHSYYSNILDTDCNTDECIITNECWRSMDHACLATAVNGEVFRDDLGQFTAFRNLLLDYYPDNIWKERIADYIHKFSACLQVNYARCMSRKDVVAARLCQLEGLEAAMQLFFLMKRSYAPYYKWTYRRLEELDTDGKYSALIIELAEASCDLSVWEDVPYRPNILNMSDPVILLAEKLAGYIAFFMRENHLITGLDRYLERYIDEILNSR